MIDKNFAWYQGCKGIILPDEIESFFKAKPYKRYLVEEKYDGIWCAIIIENGEVHLMSRNQKEKDNEQLKSLREYIKDKIKVENALIIGELAFSSQKGTQYAAKYGHHKVDVFDILYLNGESLLNESLLGRKETLYALLVVNGIDIEKDEWLKYSWYSIVVSGEAVRYEFERIIKEGGEGLILKDLEDKDYRFGGKSPFWFKIKKEVTMDYVIMGYEETKSETYKLKGFIGGIYVGLCVKGELIQKCIIGSMSDYWREEFGKNGNKYIGKVVECKGFEVFTSGALRHPSFLQIREDKNKEECTWEV